MRDKKGFKMSRTRTLNSEEQMALVQRIAWHWRSGEVVNFIKEKFGKDISEEAYFQYKRSEKWKPLIEKFREDYHKTINEVPLANKRARLEELQTMFYSAKDSGNLEEARSILRDFRDETDRRGGDVSFNFTNITHNEFHEMTDEDLHKEKMKTLEQLEKVRKLKLLTQQGGDRGVGSEGTQEAIEVQEN